MKNIIVYFILGAMLFGGVYFFKFKQKTEQQVQTIEKVITPKDDGIKPDVNAGWHLVGDLSGVRVFRKYDCLPNGTGCHWIYLSVGSYRNISNSITVVTK